ncbi:hypothetical protein DL96DRAFT_1785844 [Flagelloscypha sp. PMI_526]|nr:hypothetical protein DL96DRAFT_1785844 [Flagelloscypha sp. PMI_526]
MAASDAQQAFHSLEDEGRFRFPSFTSNDAVTLGLSIRKRFRGSNRHAKGKGLVISIQTIAGHPLFSCTVGDLGHPSGLGDTSLDSWECLESMINVTKRTGHSSYYVATGMRAAGMALLPQASNDSRPMGGSFPIWLENAPCCPIAVVAAYSGSSLDDHQLVVGTVRDYLTKIMRNSTGTIAATSVAGGPNGSVPVIPRHDQEYGDFGGESEFGPPRNTSTPAQETNKYDHETIHAG